MMIKKVLEYLTNICYSLFGIDRVGGIFMINEYTALDIATWFIYKNNAEKMENQATNDDYEVYEGLTHLKLQKLLYYAQGICLSLNNHALFSDKIEAWEHGPVVPAVFSFFSFKGRREITIKDAPSSIEVIRQIEADTDIRNALNMTYDNFAIYTAWQLRNMTHQSNTPWYQYYSRGRNRVIPNDKIKEYFDKEVMED